MFSPPLPITAPILSVSIWMALIRGAYCDSSERGSEIASFILPRIVMRACCACSSAPSA